MKNIVIIPTLNENDNINYLFNLIIKKFKIPILFIDDNLLSLNLSKDIPLIYKLRLLYKIYLFKYLFKFFLNEIWVTNNRLKSLIKKQINNKNIKIKTIKLKVSQK